VGSAPAATTSAEFRTWLRELRTRAGLSQDELARALGTDRRNVRRWELDGHDPSGTMLLRILAALGVELVPAPPRDVPGAVNAELRELRLDVREAADRAASGREALLERLDELAEQVRLLSVPARSRTRSE
jgi:transcriptional regulator with XRE-family HTH domain